MPFWFLPKEVGLKGAVYADAGGLWDYRADVVGADRRSQRARLYHADARSRRQSPEPAPACSLTTATSSAPRWVSALIWASPFGPLRFDYAVPLTKGQYDRVQQFKFGGGTSF